MTNLGVLGGGQLGRMLALAGYPLGLTCRFLDPAAEAPAGQVAELVRGDYQDSGLLAHFLDGLDLVTYEFENVSVELAERIQQQVPVYPPPAALAASQDRLAEKMLFTRLGLPTPAFFPVATRDELKSALTQLGYPSVLKTRRFGYDGKGQAVLRRREDVDPAFDALSGAPLLVEAFVRFEREVSQLAVRGRDGTTAFYPLVENHHAGGILRLTLAPAPGLTDDLQAHAVDLTRRVLETLDYVGVLAIEFFQKDGQLIANEMAPRVHNSGHWSIEGAATSQFENHLRAVLGWPLGATEVQAPCAMLNLIGTLPARDAVLAVPDAHLHLYGKEPRPGRKLGHVTLRAPTTEALLKRLAHLRVLVAE